jgi:hypothetical protein
LLSQGRLEYNFWAASVKSSAWFALKHLRPHAMNPFTTNGTLKTDLQEYCHVTRRRREATFSCQKYPFVVIVLEETLI